MLASAIKKRSVVVNGRRTSVTLEDRFWESLRTISDLEGSTIEAFVARIDTARETPNLSSAIRIAILEYVQRQSAGQWQHPANAAQHASAV